jgi:tetratricopeptide (TPR) repeat protein
MRAKSEVWEQRWAESLEKIPSQVSGGDKPSAWARFLSRRLLIKHEQNFTLQFLAGIYSRALNDWGVQLQRQDRREEVWFARAIALNSDNVSARITELYNKRYREGDRTRLEAVFLKREFEDSFVRYNDWREILNANGPVDEPTVLFEMGKALMQSGNVRQGIASFQRCSELVPSWTEPRVWAALGLLDLRDFAGALESTRELTTRAQAEDPNTLAKILFCRSLGLKGLGQTNESQAALVQFANEHRDRPDILATGVELFTQNSQFSSALVLLDQLLENDPVNLRFLAKRGWVLIELGQYAAAIETLGTVVSRSPADENARLNLAIARLGAKQYDAAQTDYEQLLNLGKKSRNALFGLAGIAWQKHETNTAVNLYQQYLSNGIPDSAQYAVAAQRLKILTAEK